MDASQTYFHVNFSEDEQGNITQIKAQIVEGDRIGSTQIFTGPDAARKLQTWKTEQRPDITGFSTDDFMDKAKMARVREMLGGQS